MKKNKISALEAKEKALELSLAPLMFQGARALFELGILDFLKKMGDEGASQDLMAQKLGLSPYVLEVLLEAGLGMGLVEFKEDRVILTKTGYFFATDPMVKVNMDFSHYVCYLPSYSFLESLINGKPEGLRTFGNWETIYEGLWSLPETVLEKWLAFDHFYSDASFNEASEILLQKRPKKILDIGGNTGKWAIHYAQKDPEAEITILDLPGAVEEAEKRIDDAGLSHRINCMKMNILDKDQPLPKDYDWIWMSQFLDCFGEEEISLILDKVHKSLDQNGYMSILEPCWDQQKFKAASYCLQAVSLYFTCLANGKSKFYSSRKWHKMIKNAGFQIVEEIFPLGLGHTLFICTKQKD
ncbi:MAG: methyltransferase domain-containing protein [Planctomycetota bacterium]|nr:MAG: methyltransferase domain-containing protein [Planctomycetota bacterium]